MLSNFLFTILIISYLILSARAHVNDTSEIELQNKSQVLSRRKRFIIFPEGSSVQLVFCVTYETIFEIGDIFLWGYTAALAYELPQDPYSPFRHHADPLHRRMDSKTIYYLNENGKIIDNKPYQRKFIVNPAMAKRSVDEFSPNEMGPFKKRAGVENTPSKIDRNRMHSAKQQELYESVNVDSKTVQFQRTSRSRLYSKIETMLEGLGGNGRSCLLKTLCLVGQKRDSPQGSFFQEILRAVFTASANPDDTYVDVKYKRIDRSADQSPHAAPGHQDNKAHYPRSANEMNDSRLPKSTSGEPILDYDVAHQSKQSCDILYPDCKEGLNDPTVAKFRY